MTNRGLLLLFLLAVLPLAPLASTTARAQEVRPFATAGVGFETITHGAEGDAGGESLYAGAGLAWPGGFELAGEFGLTYNASTRVEVFPCENCPERSAFETLTYWTASIGPRWRLGNPDDAWRPLIGWHLSHLRIVELDGDETPLSFGIGGTVGLLHRLSNRIDLGARVLFQGMFGDDEFAGIVPAFPSLRLGLSGGLRLKL